MHRFDRTVPDRQRTNGSRHIGLRRDLRNQLLDLTHAPVLGPPENLAVIVLGEMPRELMNTAQVQFPACDHAKNAGETIGRTACPDALVAFAANSAARPDHG
jgi:hypothetical protein